MVWNIHPAAPLVLKRALIFAKISSLVQFHALRVVTVRSIKSCIMADAFYRKHAHAFGMAKNTSMVILSLTTARHGKLIKSI